MKKNDRVAIIFGLSSYIIAFVSYYLLDIYIQILDIYIQTKHEFEITGLLILLWLLSIFGVNHYRTKKITKYWWVFLSLPILIGRISELLIFFAAWSIGGFAP
jgi:hypothetical protein